MKTSELKKYRQGDVYIFQVKQITAHFEKVASKILAYGEVTGHKHEVIPTLDIGTIGIAEIDGETYLRIVGTDAHLVHEEHHKIELPPGDYKVIIQREYDPILYQRKVQD